MLDEGVVLLGRALGERLEPVCVMGDALLVGPLLHALGHAVGDATVEASTVVDDVDEFLIDVARKIFIHLLAIKHILSEIVRRPVGRRSYILRLLAKSLCYDLKA